MQQTPNTNSERESGRARQRTEAGAAGDLRGEVDVADVESVETGGQAAARPVANPDGAGSMAGPELRTRPAIDTATGPIPVADGKDVCVVVDTASGTSGSKDKSLHDVSLNVTRLFPAEPSSTPNAHTENAAVPAKVLSLSVARRARLARKQIKPRPSMPELEGIDMRGIDVDRLTAEAREHYWFNVNKYARHLFVSSCDLSMKECDHPYSPICVHHVREAELKRMGMQSSQTSVRTFGLLFFMYALQILGAAAC
ncbi:MAG: hypothetical protein E4H03_13845, partial [Myxococcales bacterium]